MSVEQLLEEATYNDEGDLVVSQEAIDRLQAQWNEMVTQISNRDARYRVLQATYADTHNDLQSCQRDLQTCRAALQAEERLKEEATETCRAQAERIAELKAAEAKATERAADLALECRKSDDALRQMVEGEGREMITALAKMQRERDESRSVNADLMDKMQVMERLRDEALAADAKTEGIAVNLDSQLQEAKKKCADFEAAYGRLTAKNEELHKAKRTLTDELYAAKAAADPANREAEAVALKASKEYCLKELEDAKARIEELEEMNARQRESLDAALDSEDVGRNDALEVIALMGEEIVVLNQRLRVAQAKGTSPWALANPNTLQ